ncbi:MAG TPA: hypothetical protein VJ781_07825 [Pyrinomonadaceae bacterium]|nr:hypothetical protein [Pyrinomonadaceae bacterium]
MARFDSPLNNIKIASPCSADWEGMFGNERKRFCADCKLNVYNISGMTRPEAETLLEQSEGRLCVRYYRRADGTILTQDCPVGWAKVKQRASMIATAALSLIVSFLAGLSIVAAFSRKVDLGSRFPIPIASPTPKYEPLMGAMAMPTPSPTPKPSQTPRMGRVVMGDVSMETKGVLIPKS